MSFIEGSIALADRLGMTPDDVYILGIFGIIFWWEFLGWFFLVLFCFSRWSFRRLVRWLRSRRKKEL